MIEHNLILASTSPFRQKMLKNAGLSFISLDAKLDERDIETRSNNLTIIEKARLLAEQKALKGEALYQSKVAKSTVDNYIIGADQMLGFKHKNLHKATSLEQARKKLKQLSGQTHFLYSAYALVSKAKILHSEVVTTALTMRVLSNDFIDDYLQREGEEIFKTVGGYKIEKSGINLFEKIEGDIFSIIGLPLLPLLKTLRQFQLLD